MPVPEVIFELIEHYERNMKAFKSLNETEVRLQFIDPFFVALGWDVHNQNRYAEAYKDVVHEYSLRSATTVEAPDYLFQVGGNGKFYVEAKRPSVAITTDTAPAYQVRSYGWTSKLPIAILTNFANLAVYDCRKEPIPKDKASVARVDLFHFREYPSRWDELYNRFSRDAVYKGSFDKYGESSKGKKGTTDVDQAFLAEIETWRSSLAINLAKRNKDLNQRELNFAVQRTIDRIIFLRICEDRGIEKYGQLQELIQGGDVYDRLRTLYERADEKYNSGLFHFTPERGREEEPDSLTLGLSVDDTTMKGIIKRLYYPESPYRFSHFPPDVLGQVYEQFLGRVISLTPDHKVKIELKPEIRKAGGVYYTPSYIVRHIIQKTVNESLAGMTPRTAANLKIVDPACGSGSFLIGAYQALLDWHKQWYLENDSKKSREVLYQVGSNEWRLTIQERRRILLNNIYGVDIDLQAVEVAKLSLLLKVLEGESEETIGNNLRLFHQRALPDLGNNLKCGNSLIATDYFKTRQMLLIDEHTRYRINAFDWGGKDGFPGIMKAGGFDLVIGNPPYLYSAAKEDAEYFDLRFEYAQYQTDFYVYFIEKALKIAKQGGRVSFIVSDSWLNSERISRIRNFLLEHRLLEVAIFDYQVFHKVTLENSIFVVQKGAPPSDIPIVRFTSPEKQSQVNKISPEDAISSNMLDPHFSAGTVKILKKIEAGGKPLALIVKLNRGLHAYRTDGYGKSAFKAGPQTTRDKEEESYHSDAKLSELYFPELRGKQVGRFEYVTNGRFVKYGPWLAEPRQPEFFTEPKIVLRKVLGKRLSGTFLEGEAAIDQSLYIGISRDGSTGPLKHALAVLLSGVGAWYLRNKYSIFDNLYPWYTKKQLDLFPMVHVDNELVQSVDTIMSLHSQLGAARTDQSRTSIHRQIEFMEKSIDIRVYELYRLTEKEVAVLEAD